MYRCPSFQSHRGTRRAFSRVPPLGSRHMALAFFPPCVPKPTQIIPTGDQWEHEPKLDGFRLQVVKERRSIRLFTRRGADWSRRLQSLSDALKSIPAGTAILDCELVYLAPSGQLLFEPLMFGSDKFSDGLNVFAFDLLYLNGRDLTERPWQTRRKLLVKLLERAQIPCLHLVSAFEDGAALYAAIERLGLEGVVSKRQDAAYRSGPSSDWLKRKTTTWRQAHSERWKLFERK